MSSYEVEDQTSTLLRLLLNLEDFDAASFNIDFLYISQKSFRNDELIEKASFGVMSFHMPEHEYLISGHELFLLNDPFRANLIDFYVFRYEPEAIFEINEKLIGVDSTKCTKYGINEFQECIFLKSYDNVVSMVTVTIRNDVELKTILEWVSPLLEKINTRMEK